MKRYVIEIEVTEQDLAGDEWWEGVIEQDPTGIKGLLEILADMLEESNIVVGSGKEAKEFIKLKKFTDD